jgi:rod shape-determining protein MreD
MNSNRVAFGVAVGLGLLMDGLSGAPFGLYTTAYVWMAVIVRRMTTIIRADQAGMIQLFAGLGVLFQAMVILILTAMIDPEFRIPFNVVEGIGMQMLLAAIFAPFLFSLFYRFQGAGEVSMQESQSRSGRKQWRTTSKV